jgi:hypothetical protein
VADNRWYKAHDDALLKYVKRGYAWHDIARMMELVGYEHDDYKGRWESLTCPICGGRKKRESDLCGACWLLGRYLKDGVCALCGLLVPSGDVLCGYCREEYPEIAGLSRIEVVRWHESSDRLWNQRVSVAIRLSCGG